MTLAERLEALHALGREHVAPHAAAVDAEARFPREAFDALKEAGWLSSYVPVELGGWGLSVSEVGRACEALAAYDGSVAMIFAMHQIQVACIVHHSLHEPTWQAFCRELVERQLLLASATTELGIGGDVRTSGCHVAREGARFRLEKKAPVISYGLESDAILVTARKDADAAASDQVHVVVRRDQAQLEPLSSWDTMGFRGTCSLGFVLRAEGDANQVLPVPYAQIHTKTMHPFSHSVWASLWLGMASEAVRRARAVVRKQARKSPDRPPPSALRLAEVDAQLSVFAALVHDTVRDYEARLVASGDEPFPSDFDFASRVNNLKVKSSELVVDVVGRALLICGISGYRNDSKGSLARILRDAYGAALMVNNDRILLQSATMQIVRRG